MSSGQGSSSDAMYTSSTTTTNKVYLTELYCYPHFETYIIGKNSDINKKAIPYVFAILLRLLLLCDQLHDFREKDERNALSEQPDWNNKKTEIYQTFIKYFNDDYKFINDKNIYYKDILILDETRLSKYINDQLRKLNIQLNVYKVSKEIIELFGIFEIDSEKLLLNKPLNWQMRNNIGILFNLLNINKPKTLFIDTNKSYYGTNMLSSFAFDMSEQDSSYTGPINIITTPASNFDSAPETGFYNILNQIQK